MAVTGRFDPSLMSRHATREARRERLSLEMIRLAYEDPDSAWPSDLDELREIRTRWFGAGGVETVVDVDDGRVVSVWRKGEKA
jgi:anti-sigma factor ChrR (cupin superfamily)